jgi:hypothetical protein
MLESASAAAGKTPTLLMITAAAGANAAIKKSLKMIEI